MRAMRSQAMPTTDRAAGWRAVARCFAAGLAMAIGGLGPATAAADSTAAGVRSEMAANRAIGLAPAPIAIRLNCFHDSFNGHAHYGGSNISLSLDERGTAQAVLRPRVSRHTHGNFWFSICWDPKDLRDVQWTLPATLPLARTHVEHAFRFEPTDLSAERGKRTYTIGLRGKRVQVDARNPRNDFAAVLTLEIDYVVVPDIRIQAIEIEDYRPNRRGVLRDTGVLDPLSLQQADQAAGVVVLIGRNLIARDTEVDVGGTPGTLEQRESSGGIDRLRVRVPRFTTTPHRIVVRRGDWSSPAYAFTPVAYRAYTSDELGPLLQQMRIVLGQPRGQGSITLMEQVTPLTLGPVINERGLLLELSDLRSRAARASFADVADGTVEMLLEVDFESAGEELVGTLLSEIDVWRCGKFEIVRNRCDPIGADCLRRALGDAWKSAGACTSPTAWGAQRVRGPSRVVRGNVENARIKIWLRIAADRGSGRTIGALQRVDFEARIDAAVDGADLPLRSDDVQVRIQREVRDRLFDQFVADNLAQRIANQLHLAMSVNLVQPRMRGFYAMRGGSGIFADIQLR